MKEEIKMKFPFKERDFIELDLLKEVGLPVFEDFQILYSAEFEKISRYSCSYKSPEGHLAEEMEYGKNGILKSRKFFNKDGKMWKEEIGELKGNRFVLKSKNVRILWKFNEDFFLEEIIYSKAGQDKKIKFEYNEFKQVSLFNNLIEIKWKGKKLLEAKDKSENIVLTKIAQRTKFLSKVFYPNIENRSSAVQPRNFQYDQNGRLISDKWGSWETEINYFDFGGTLNKHTIKKHNGRQLLNYEEETTVVDENTIQVWTELEREEGKSKEYNRIFKTKRS